MKPTLLWFRRDLRLAANPALAAALERGAPVLPVFIHSPEEEAPWAPGGASRWWLHHSLLALRDTLAAYGLPLCCFRGPARTVLPRLVQVTGADAVAWNRIYEPLLAARDGDVAAVLRGIGVAPLACDSGLFFTPGTVLNGRGEPYRVFAPFWRQLRRRLGREGAALDAAPARPGAAAAAPVPDGAGEVVDLGLLDAHPWHAGLADHWSPGEAGARRRLAAFVDGPVTRYDRERDRPDLEGTSRLAPHFHFGELTPAQVHAALAPALDGPAAPAAEAFLRELGWREFAVHTLWHFPALAERALDPRFEDARLWPGTPGHLEAWRRGRTGVALVDAGMRELWRTGWMHNRVRMVAASFLTKNLGVHWREGARWFWETLVDADLASNGLGWQWAAGSGPDAAPYFRIFNPDTQAARFDPQGAYRRRWLAEAAAQPPVVDPTASRRAALARYQDVVKGR